jgi:hypothetical protein
MYKVYSILTSVKTKANPTVSSASESPMVTTSDLILHPEKLGNCEHQHARYPSGSIFEGWQRQNEKIELWDDGYVCVLVVCWSKHSP